MAEETRHFLTNGQETLPLAREALDFASQTSAKMVDLKFCDLLGTWQHVSLPVSAFREEDFEEGLGFDGSSIRGWQGISESDMLLMPQAETAIIDPFTEAPTLSLICEIADPLRTRAALPVAPRSSCARAVSRTPPTSAPSASSSSSTRSATSSARTSRTTSSIRARGTGTRASPASATRSARRRATSRPPRTTRSPTCARRWC